MFSYASSKVDSLKSKSPRESLNTAASYVNQMGKLRYSTPGYVANFGSDPAGTMSIAFRVVRPRLINMRFKNQRTMM